MAKDKVGTLFEGDASDLLQEMDKINARQQKLEDRLKGTTAQTKKLTQEEKAFGRETKRALDEIRGPQQQYQQRTRALHALLKKGTITQREFNSALRRTKERYQSAGRAGQQAFGPQALGQVKGMLGGFVSITAAVAAISRGVQVWLQNMREIAAEGKKAGDEMVALAALQEPGKKRERVMAATKLGARYGIQERGLAYDTVQAMQSASGSFEQGIKLAETVFAAKQAGMTVEDAKEIATLALGLGFDPNVALRRAHVAGKASMRSPKELAPAGAGLKYWQDRQLGWAAAAVLAGTVPAQKLETYTKRGGMALMRTPGAAQDAFAQMGLGEATQFERLKALQKAGVTTPEAAAQFGFTEIREAEAVSDLVKQFDKVQQIYGTIQREAKPGLFAAERGQVEKELPETRRAREIDMLAAKAADAKAFGPRAQQAQRLKIESMTAALALRERGKEEFLWFDLITEGKEPELTLAGRAYWRASGTRKIVGDLEFYKRQGREVYTPPSVATEYMKIQTELEEAAARLNTAAANLEASTRARPVVENH